MSQVHLSRVVPGLAGAPDDVDLVVVGLGITGAGVALDAVTRGLRVLAVDAHDLAFGTSRWSSKLVHGGLRYLASGQVGVAHESAVERHLLMRVVAPHLTHPMPYVVPFGAGVSRTTAAITRGGMRAGDALRRAARTDVETLPGVRRLSATETLHLAPALRRPGLRGSMMAWDGQLEDDARLVTTVARTAASYGAHVRTRARVLEATRERVVMRDELTGATRTVTTRAVVNATGVWAGDLAGRDGEVRLRPSRGTHLVLRSTSIPDLRVAVFCPVGGSTDHFVMLLPQPDGTIYVGLTDVAVDGPVPEVPHPTAEPTAQEVDFLLETVSASLAHPIDRSHVVGAFAGLRPLLDTGAGGETADISRRHAVLTGRTGVTTVVGGKLTTYRRMAQDAVDAAVEGSTLSAGPCLTRSLPLLGAADRGVLASLAEPERLVRRFGTDAALVLDRARSLTGLGDDELLAPIADGIPVTLAELVFGVSDEGAHDVGDLLDRRVRVGLVPADREHCLPAARRALVLARGQVTAV